jgi:hypothetical protein
MGRANERAEMGVFHTSDLISPGNSGADGIVSEMGP